MKTAEEIKSRILSAIECHKYVLKDFPENNFPKIKGYYQCTLRDISEFCIKELELILEFINEPTREPTGSIC